MTFSYTTELVAIMADLRRTRLAQCDRFSPSPPPNGGTAFELHQPFGGSPRKARTTRLVECAIR